MKNIFKTLGLGLLALLVGSLVGLTIIGSNRLSEIKKQNALLERHIQVTADQNDLLRENKMCLDFRENRPDMAPALPMQ